MSTNITTDTRSLPATESVPNGNLDSSFPEILTRGENMLSLSFLTICSQLKTNLSLA